MSYLLNQFFSHIYVENKALEYELTKSLLAKFKKSITIPIENYKEIFNRSKQDWQKQASSRKLILATKPDNYLYETSSIIQPSEYEHSYYTTPVLNCIYNCSYCFLQGLYPSANVVVFVNLEDFFGAVEQKLSTISELHLNLSYETDLLGFETLLGLNRAWYEFAKSRANLILETRTKSANFSSIQDLKPIPNFVLTWTLSPDEIQSKHENNTATLEKRLQALLLAKSAGWQTRICVDPIIYRDDFEVIYAKFFSRLKERLPAEDIQTITLGVFRMNTDFLTRIKKQERQDELIYYPYVSSDRVSSYGSKLSDMMLEYCKAQIA